jgi:Arc/MetJ family transcription regulator
MRTNIVLDDATVEEARRLTGIRTKRALVQEALELLIATRKRKSLLDLRGRVAFFAGYDHKALRRGRP